MKKSYKFKIKTYIFLERKTTDDKKIYLNLNCYRNMQHFENNNAKKKFKEIYDEQIQNCPIFTKPVKIKFKLIKNSKRKTDKHNFYSVAAKYLYDALTECGKWQDDNDDFIKKETLLETKYDKNLEDNIMIFEIEEIE